MRVIKKLQKVGDKVYKHYFIETENKKRLQIRVAFVTDLPKLDYISEFEKDTEVTQNEPDSSKK